MDLEQFYEQVYNTCLSIILEDNIETTSHIQNNLLKRVSAMSYPM